MPPAKRDDTEKMSMFAYTGCRTTKERSARGEGIGVYAMGAASGEWRALQTLKTVDNPSYLAFDRSRRFLYAVHGDLQIISAFRIDHVKGTLSPLNNQDCGGKNPVFLVPDPTNKYMIVANYASGSLGALPINGDGSLGRLADQIKLAGTPGPHKVEQQSLHPHMLCYDKNERFILVPDKGGDQICTFKFDAATGKLSPGDPPSAKTRDGLGPRHVTFHPTMPLAYVAHELGSSVGVYRYEPQNGSLKPLQILPAVPADFTGNNTAAGIGILPSGKFLYLSNRGHDSLACYAIDKASGFLSSVGWTSTQGKGPRFFTVDPSGKLLYAANELTDTIVAFHVDGATGALKATGQVVPTGSPTCIVFNHARG